MQQEEYENISKLLWNHLAESQGIPPHRSHTTADKRYIISVLLIYGSFPEVPLTLKQNCTSVCFHLSSEEK